MINFLKYKSIFIYLITIVLVFLWVGVVFWSNLVFDVKIDKIDKLSKNIFIDSKNLRNDLIIYTSWEDLSWFKLFSPCKIESKFVWNKLNKYVFQVKYLSNCFNSNLYLENKYWNKLLGSKVNLNIFTKAKIFELFSDLDNKNLFFIRKYLNNKLNNLVSKKDIFSTLEKDRLKQELNYKLSILNDIIYLRSLKYLTPIKWVWTPTKLSKIPNSPRPYRSSYTDWIHHWWDFDTSFRHDVRAIDSWVIVRIISDFKFSDLNKIKKSKNLTKQEKLDNLNILRWNQVWLKTSRWDVVFYSHLDSITSWLKVWDFVNKWDIIWKVGISWVPDKNYKDYHMHMPIQKNPYIISKVWKYTFNDYENWDWYFKWKSSKYILENQDKVFKK